MRQRWLRVVLSALVGVQTLLSGGLAFLPPGSGSVPVAQAAPAPAPLAATNVLQLSVVSARAEPRAFGGTGVAKGAPVTTYKYIINIDNTGTTTQRTPADGCSPSSPGYPNSCQWVSIAGVPGSSPIYTQGTQDDFPAGITLPDGRYLISVLADGYKLDGAHFTVPMPGTVTVELQPFPLPDATIRAFVFEDITPTNSAPDAPAEHGLPGFVGHIADYIDEVTTDVYGNPLCTRYEGEDPITFAIPVGSLDADGLPVPIAGSGGRCVSDADGMIAIPHVGPNRYAFTAVKPDGTNWIQTTTLEGNHDWDAWVMEGATGYDTEFVVAGEQFPPVFFGFVKPTNALAPGGTGQIKGVVAAVRAYVPPQSGVVVSPNTPNLGAAIDHNIDGPWIALVDLQAADTAVWVGKGNADGSFTIPNVPNGDYSLVYWDEPQDYILDLVNVTVANGQIVDLGVLRLAGWWTRISGHVFNDLNGNGKMDSGEPGLANFPVSVKKRENSLMDRGAVTVTTDAQGYYFMENAYPMTQWLVIEAYADLYQTTGVTYQADNQDTETTVLGAGVDVSVLPIIGLGGRLDWGVKAYAPGTNGGIVGTVSYDTTRNELDPAFSAVENWQPGVSNIPVLLYAPVNCGTNAGVPCDVTDRYELAADGSFAKGKLLNTYLTETWSRPTSCVARDVNGDPLPHGAGGEQVLPTTVGAGCLEGPLMGVQFGPYATDQGTPDANFGAAVDGNYGFGDMCTGTLDATNPAEPVCNGGTFVPLTPADYIVSIQLPNDALGRPLYKVTKEEDINIFNGDQFVPQIPPPPCVGPVRTVDVAGVLPDGANAVDNPAFADAGGSPYEGTPRALCDSKLVRVSNGRSIAPAFTVFTDVPIPVRFWGLLVDDLNFSSDPRSLLYGEKAGVPFAPVGIYDYTNRLVTTVESDFNGLYDVLLPSTNRINCPTPSGVCANLYRFVGNDPGVPGRLNLNYNPQFRTIAAEFEAFPGLIVPADLAPTQMAATVQLPGTQFLSAVSCALPGTTPQLFAVSKPFVRLSDPGNSTFTIAGLGFGAAAGQVTLDGTIVLPTASWTDTSMTVTVPDSTAPGVHQLAIRAANGQSTVNGLSFHVLGAAPFPATGVLDNFNRANGALGANWSQTSQTAFRIQSNAVQVRQSEQDIYLPGGSTSAFYGPDQEAYFTFTQIGPQSSLTPDSQQVRQGVVLKQNGSVFGTNASNATWVEAAYVRLNAANTNGRVVIRTKITGTGGSATVVRATFGSDASPITFAIGDQLGARALSDGTVNVYKNGVLVGSTNVTAGGNPWPASLASGGGRIGVRWWGTANFSAGFDNFGGGNVASYSPNVYEVGPTGLASNARYVWPTTFDELNPPHPIQNALDDAAASAGDDLVVVYPGIPQGDRINPRGAYYENIIISSPVKLQGVGPGGINADLSRAPGSIIDGLAYGGDTALATAWQAKLASLTWVGNQDVGAGQVMTVLAQSTTQYGAAFRAAVDGFDIRGGDQQGQANILTQGGAIFANAYVRNLQITNNAIEGNSSSYGTVRIGTPNLPAPDTSQHNENLRIANNRIFANSGTNLAGAIGLFAGSDNYEVAANDLCGNFSAEYGGAISHHGLSPNGKIHDNRIYYNQSYDEGGGITIAGELPASPTILSPGSGPVDIYNNLIQANMANDDGGGIRFLMAGNFPINVYNNMIVNNVSTHEGGGVAIDDAPNVRFYNNTVMRNITTATAVTSNGQPAPAGLSTAGNSDLLQATLPAGSPLYSNPLLFNNIFWENRAGTRGLNTVTGLADADANRWDIGVIGGIGLLAPTNSIVQQNAGIHPYTTSATNISADPMVIGQYATVLTFAPWRTNVNLIGAIMVTADNTGSLQGNYHLAPGTPAPAVNAGAASKVVPTYQRPPNPLNAPAFDFDNQTRTTPIDIGADER